MPNVFRALIAGLLLVLAAKEALAQTPCAFESRLEALRTIEDLGPDSPDGIRAELAIRKALLTQVIDCALLENENLRETVQKLESSNPEIGRLKDRASEVLLEAGRYYSLKKSLVQNLGLRGSKDLARELRDWRASYYLPLTEEISQLTLWAANQPLFQTAAKRLEEVRQAVTVLKIFSGGQSELFGQAEKSLRRAEDLNSEAKEALLRLDPNDDSFTLIRDSLEALSQTYRSFFELSAKASKLVPLP